MKLCGIGWHKWKYIENSHGGKPMSRVCQYCGKWQAWDYDKARQYGIIEWVSL